MATVTLEIVDGPSKFDIMLALFMTEDRRGVRHAVHFKCPDFPSFQKRVDPKIYSDTSEPLAWCVIDGVTRPSQESDDTDIWIFTGRCTCTGKEWGYLVRYPFTAQYSMATRKGSMRLTFPEKDAAK